MAISGKIGVPPPANAPRETSQPLTQAELDRQFALAQAHSPEPVPFAPKPEDQIRPISTISAEKPAISSVKPPDLPVPTRVRPDPSAINPNLTHVEASFSESSLREGISPPVVPVPAAPPVATPELAFRPAQSDTDSPSRGIPKGISDPGKQISGGFGAAHTGQYVPLDGRELGLLVLTLLDELAVKLPQDLRFSSAICYPRVRARVEVIVEAYPDDSNYKVTRSIPPHERTPLDVARALCDEVVFTLVAERREFDDNNDVSSPANAMRASLGLQIPHKQLVETPGGMITVDVLAEPRS